MEQANETDLEALRERFLARLDDLLGEIRQWVAADSEISVATRVVALDDPFGHYDAPGLELRVNGEKIASVTPHAGVVIGAEGRVDVAGRFDSLAALYLGGPGETSVDLNGAQFSRRELFEGFSAAGWYWFISNATMDVRRIDHDTFRIMLAAVSGFNLSMK